MNTYIAYKNKIQGFKDVNETVKTTEKIAASSIHFLENIVGNLEEFNKGLSDILLRLSLFYQVESNFLLEGKKGGHKMLVFITGDNGLVGGLWHNGVNAFLHSANNNYKDVVVIGKKGKRYLEEEKKEVTKLFKQFSNIPKSEEIENITEYIFSEFKNKNFSQIDILYPKFISLTEQRYSFIQFLPFKFNINNNQKKIKENNNNLGFPIFEPNKKDIFDNLLKKYIGTFFNRIVMESKLSELSSRMITAENAVTKTEELIKKTILNYRKNMRRNITQKQLESFSVHKII